jgi:hypothetical protein
VTARDWLIYAMTAGIGAAFSLFIDLVVIPIWKKTRRK